LREKLKEISKLGIRGIQFCHTASSLQSLNIPETLRSGKGNRIIGHESTDDKGHC